MPGNNQMLTDEEGRAIGCAAWVTIAVSLVILMCLLAAAGCVSAPDMSRDMAVGVTELLKYELRHP